MNQKKHPLRFYVYAYLRDKDSLTAKAGTPYYIGKGQGNRVYKGHGVLKIPSKRQNIIFLETNLTEVGALALERRYIEWYGRKCMSNGILTNLTAGGDGVTGYTVSYETRKKISNTLLGNVVSDKIKEKISKTTTGMGNHMYGKKHTQESKEKMSKSQLGKSSGPWTEERKQAARKAIAARIALSPMKESTKELLRKPQMKVICPHCGKEGGNSIMQRHHFDRCKTIS